MGADKEKGLAKQFPDLVVLVHRADVSPYDFSITRKFSDAEELLKWFARPLGVLAGEPLKYTAFDALRTTDQAQHMTQQNFEPNVWRPWLNEATVETYAKWLFLKDR